MACNCSGRCNCLIQVADTATIDMSISGIGSPVSPYIISADFIGSAGSCLPFIVVAASDSDPTLAACATFQCDGTDDDIEIQAAINLISANQEILLLDGTYNITSTILAKSCVIRGLGTAVFLTSSTVPIISLDFKTRLKYLELIQLGDFEAIISTEGSWAIEFCRVFSISSNGSFMIDCDTNAAITITNCRLTSEVDIAVKIASRAVFTDNFVDAGAGIFINGAHNIISNNQFQLTTDLAIYINGNYNVVESNNIDTVVTFGIYIAGNDNSVVGNHLTSYGTDGLSDGIEVEGDRNSVQGNFLRKLASTPIYGINILATAADSFVTNNDLLTSGVTASYIDAGTGTIIGAGNRT